jgi:hypothetical protein
MLEELTLLSDVLNGILSMLTLLLSVKLYLNTKKNPRAAVASIFNRGMTAFKLFALAGLVTAFALVIILYLSTFADEEMTQFLLFLDSLTTVPPITLLTISVFILYKVTGQVLSE